MEKEIFAFTMIGIALVAFAALWAILRYAYKENIPNNYYGKEKWKINEDFKSTCQNNVFELGLYKNYSNYTYSILRKFISFALAMIVMCYLMYDLSYIYTLLVTLTWYMYIKKRKFLIKLNTFRVKNKIESEATLEMYSALINDQQRAEVDEGNRTLNVLYDTSKDVLKISIFPAIYHTFLYLIIVFFAGWYL